MLLRKEVGNQKPEGLGNLLEAMLRRSSAVADPDDDPLPERPPGDTSGRYDFDLAEFPLFRFYRTPAKNRDPLAYTDTITGHDGKPVAREWKAYPGPFGFGGASTQTLLYDLLQLYVEQGARGSQIQFGTLRSLFLRRGERNPSKRDYDRMRRDLDSASAAWGSPAPTTPSGCSRRRGTASRCRTPAGCSPRCSRTWPPNAASGCGEGTGTTR